MRGAGGTVRYVARSPAFSMPAPHLVIVGNGIAGVTAARHARKLDAAARITLISDETPTPFSRTALMYVYMGTLTQAHTALYEERFWAENRIERVHDRALRLDPGARTLTLRDGGALAYDRLLVATGSRPAFHGWPGQELGGVQGLYHLADLEAMTAAMPGGTAAEGRRGVVVGGGLIGVEMAEMLRVRGYDVTFLVREPRYMPRIFSEAESALVAAEIRRHGVDLRLGAELGEILDDGAGRVGAVTTAEGERIEAAWVGIGTGVRPNVEWLQRSGVEVGRGVLVDAELRTSASGVFAAGDCAELRTPPPGEPAVRPIWYTARLQGATAGLGLAGQPRAYAPGVFFNSAKFFDLEYQVYGRAEGALPAGEADHEIVETSPALAGGGRSVRLQHRLRPDGSAGAVVGISALGVRLRQTVCTDWIARGAPLAEVLADLRAADFDPELTRPLVA